jgi:hypothetical protein
MAGRASTTSIAAMAQDTRAHLRNRIVIMDA